MHKELIIINGYRGNMKAMKSIINSCLRDGISFKATKIKDGWEFEY